MNPRSVDQKLIVLTITPQVTCLKLGKSVYLTYIVMRQKVSFGKCTARVKLELTDFCFDINPMKFDINPMKFDINPMKFDHFDWILLRTFSIIVESYHRYFPVFSQQLFGVTILKIPQLMQSKLSNKYLKTQSRSGFDVVLIQFS